MKKILCMIFAFIMCFSLCACEEKKAEVTTLTSESDAEETKKEPVAEVKLGDVIESDILRITLLDAQLAIKLNSSSFGTYEQIQSGNTTLDDNYFKPETYNPATDAGKAYIAPKGHTYVAMEIKAENLDRASVGFDRPVMDNWQFITVEYDGKTYTGETKYGCESEDALKWKRYSVSGVLLMAAEQKYYRCFVDIPVDAKSLEDDFSVTFSLPKSDGSKQSFKYLVTASDRKAVAEKEIPLEEAKYKFLKEEGQEYFKKHMAEYPVQTENEMNPVLEDFWWNFTQKTQSGSWEGSFRFESSGKIKESHSLIGTGYFNDRRWEVSGGNLILKSGRTGEREIFEVRKIDDKAYLLVMDGNPAALLTK